MMNKKYVKLILAGMGISAAFVACQKYLDPATFQLEPTWAVPLVDGELSVGDLLNVQENELESVYEFKDDGDSVFSLRLTFFDTIDPIRFDAFGAAGAPVPGREKSIDLEEQDVFLRMLGRFDGGYFHLTEPIIEFIFDNHVDAEFEVEFVDTYTREKDDGTKYPFTINDKASIPANGTDKLVVSNANTSPAKALTEVFEPTPKYLYYTPRVTLIADSVPESGEIDIITKVTLPMEGYGIIEYKDTFEYDFVDPELLAGLDFAILRIAITNGLPIEAEMSGEIFHTDNNFNFIPVGAVPLYDESGNSFENLSDNRIIVGAAQPTTNPSGSPTALVSDPKVTELRIYGDDINNFADGNRIILTVKAYTTGESDKKAIKIFSDQTLKVQMGIRAGASLTGQELLDLGGDSTSQQ